MIRPTLSHYLVPRSVLADTRTLLEPSTAEQVEGVVVWAGKPIDDHHAVIGGAIRPRQVAYRSELGLSVEVPPDALSELISILPDGMAVLARVHTHPSDAYHSSTDDANLLIAHVGAISIVVPDFARGPIELSVCSIHELQADGSWRELRPAEVAERFEVIDD